MPETLFSNLDNTKKLAVIITAQHDGEGVFSKGKGYYQANKQLLIENNYQVIEIDNIDSIETIQEKLFLTPCQSIDFGSSVFAVDFKRRACGNPPQKQSTRRVEFSRSKEGDSINDNIKTQ